MQLRELRLYSHQVWVKGLHPFVYRSPCNSISVSGTVHIGQRMHLKGICLIIRDSYLHLLAIPCK